MEIGVKTDKGIVRDKNQDAYYVSFEEIYPLFIIADGMGGHKAGETASEMAIEIINKNFKQSLLSSEEEIKKRIRNSIYDANEKIYKKAMKYEKFSGMGTTVTMAYIMNDKIFVGHVGDSRAYILRNNKFFQITEDHSLVEELIKNGSISKEEARCHPQRNIITRAVGTSLEIMADIIVEPKYKDDILLLCTDGLTNMLDDEEIKEFLLRNDNMQKTCEDLVEFSNHKGGFDNITVLAVKF